MVRRMPHFMRYLSTLVVLLVGLLTLGVAAPALAAQAPGRPHGGERDSLELRVRQRMTQMLQRQLGLTDEQTQKLGATSRKFEQQHRDLFVRERQVRLGLRDEIALGDTSRQVQVSRLLDQMLLVQKQRVELLEAEQRELATFMTPQQRARYFGMQEQIRRRVDEMREQGGRPQGGRPQGGRPPAGPGLRGGARRPPGGAS